MSENEKLTLGQTQKAVAEIEAKMREFLFQFHPAADLRVSDVNSICRYARDAAFDTFERFIQSDKP